MYKWPVAGFKGFRGSSSHTIVAFLGFLGILANLCAFSGYSFLSSFSFVCKFPVFHGVCFCNFREFQGDCFHTLVAFFPAFRSVSMPFSAIAPLVG